MRYILLLFVFFIPFTFVRAEYVLPYPGVMPGNKIYKVSRIIDKFQYYWHWGSIARTRYYMGISDKYLVEAKTLFEYKQYLLAVDALNRSNLAWVQISPSIRSADNEGKDVAYMKHEFNDEAVIHQQVITNLATQLPEKFTWSPEKGQSTELQLKQLLETSISLRKQ